MSEKSSCIEKEALVDYLYEESDADARRGIGAHLRSCARCAGEMESLMVVRQTIEAWEPPDADLGFRVVAEASRPRARIFRRPAWALAAAAVLAVAAALIVRPEVEVRSGEMVLRIGWSDPGAWSPAAAGGPPPEPAAARPASPEPPPGPTLRGTPAGLRTGGAAIPTPGPRLADDPDPMAPGDDALLQQLRALIRDDAAARQDLLNYVRQVSESR